MYTMDEYQRTLQAESTPKKEASAAGGTDFDQRKKASETEEQYKMMEQGMEDSELRNDSEHTDPCMVAEEGEHCRWEEERDLDPDLDLMAGALHAWAVQEGHSSPEFC